jgi:predicted RNase H-like HicB family nuclease
MLKHLTAIIEKEEDGYVALCPELDIASQGNSVEEARSNLKEALELFFETASKKEIDESTITVIVPAHNLVRKGTLMSIIRQSKLPKSEFE